MNKATLKVKISKKLVKLGEKFIYMPLSLVNKLIKLRLLNFISLNFDYPIYCFLPNNVLALIVSSLFFYIFSTVSIMTSGSYC